MARRRSSRTRTSSGKGPYLANMHSYGGGDVLTFIKMRSDPSSLRGNQMAAVLVGLSGIGTSACAQYMILRGKKLPPVTNGPANLAFVSFGAVPSSTVLK